MSEGTRKFVETIEARSNKRVCKRAKAGHSFRTPSVLPCLLNNLNNNSVVVAGVADSTKGHNYRMNTIAGIAKNEHASIATAGAALDESSAKRQIDLICRTPACWRSSVDLKLMVYLLQKFPVLASKVYDWDFNLFWKPGNEWSSPLSFLVVAGAELEDIVLVQQLYPAALWQPSGIHRDLPLHFAARFGASEDVLRFLLSKFSVAVTISNLSGELPIHCAMGKQYIYPYGKFCQARLEIIHLLVEVYPQSLLRAEHEKQYTPLQLAFNHGYSFQVIQYLISRLPKQMKEFKLLSGCYHKCFGVKVDRLEAELISCLLPRLQSFHCQPTVWNVEGLSALLDCIGHQKRLNEFRCLEIPPRLFQEGAVVSAFTSLLKNNRRLKVLKLFLATEDKEESRVDTFLQSLSNGLEKNEGLKVLELNNISVSAQAAKVFLSNKHVSEEVHFNNFRLVSSCCDVLKNHHGTPHGSNKVTKLALSTNQAFLEDNRHGLSEILSLLNCIARLPKLLDLTLSLTDASNLNITEPIVHLLKNASLKKLTIRGPTLETSVLCEALQTTIDLRHLDCPRCFVSRTSQTLLAQILKEHNATLQIVRLEKGCAQQHVIEYKEIMYLLELNRMGRAILREPNTSKATVIKQLAEVQSRGQTCPLQDPLNFYYGLLREAPGLWV